jgi:glycosyltransferase involved in cell wall biosynthesis
VGGSPEAVEDGVTGALVAKNDASGLAAAVASLLRDPARRARMGEAAAARAAALFDEERVMTALLDAYESVATRPA